MLVRCDKCGQSYEIDNSRIPAKGAKMKCPTCRCVLFVQGDGTAVPLDIAPTVGALRFAESQTRNVVHFNRVASRFQNYKIEVFELAWLSDEQIERLTGDLKVLAVFLRKMRRQELDDWPDLEIKYVPEVLDLLTAITGHRQFKQNKRKYAKRQGRITMCELFQKHDNDLIKKGRAEGMKQGEAKGEAKGKAEGEKCGLAKGMAQKALDIAKNLIAMHMPEEDVAKATGLSLKQVQALAVGA